MLAGFANSPQILHILRKTKVGIESSYRVKKGKQSMTISEETGSRLEIALKRLGVHTNMATEWAWVAARVGVAATAMIGSAYYRETFAYLPLLGLAGFALLYDALLALALSRKRLLLAFLVGFGLDNLVLLGGWWVAVSAQAGALQTNDLYLILFPVLVIGVMRLGWLLGALYTALWLGWMAWTYLTYFPPESYIVQQIPLRILFMAITAIVVLHLISRLASERQRVESLLGDVQRQAGQLAESNTKLQEIDRLRQTLLLTIAHELKTPITVVKATAELLQAREKNTSDELKGRLLRNLNSGVEKLERLIIDTVDYVAAEGGSLNLELQTIDIVEIHRAVSKKIKPLFTSRGQNLEVSLPESVHYVSADPQRCEQIIHNLLSRASAWSNPGEKITMDMAVSQDEVLTCIAELGPEIPASEREKAFLPFYRLGEPDGKGSAESGLGLALSSKLAELHQGRLWMESNGGKGNKFFLTLPIASKSPDISG
ncbi:MAG: HAMP domain-containing sensor histidine kinase [Dehalococcoidia bacterium]|nr:HAMP domain-containing sensor histidine kinase [Dehalococcoidia bacterium]